MHVKFASFSISVKVLDCHKNKLTVFTLYTTDLDVSVDVVVAVGAERAARAADGLQGGQVVRLGRLHASRLLATCMGWSLFLLPGNFSQ